MHYTNFSNMQCLRPVYRLHVSASVSAYFSGNLLRLVKCAHNALLFRHFVGWDYHLTNGTFSSSLQVSSMIVTAYY